MKQRIESIEDKRIASIDAFREVYGHDIGDTVLYYEVIQMKGQSIGMTINQNTSAVVS